MKVNEFLRHLDIPINADWEVEMITEHSKEINENSIYFDCVSGKYLDEVTNNQQVRLIVTNVTCDDPRVIYNKEPNKLFARALRYFYKDKMSKYTVIGVTGTNGKTTTSLTLRNYFRYLKKDCILVSSLGIYLNEIFRESPNTTPRIGEIYRAVADFQTENGVLIVETSSQGLRQGRIWGIDFDGIVLTNILSDHLDYHRTGEDYFFSKSLILGYLKPTGVIVACGDKNQYQNPSYMDCFRSISYQSFSCFGFDESNDYLINGNPADFTINSHPFSTQLIGKCNVYNIAGVYGLLAELKFPLEDFGTFLETLEPISGRYQKEELFQRTIMLDYAHTASATLSFFETIAEIPHQRVLTVIGCGGNRDRTKRPLMAQAACKNSDFVVFTEDNNRSEPFCQIIKDMVRHLKADNYSIARNRIDAIKMVWDNSQPGDLICLLGKGIEKSVSFDGLIEGSDIEIIKVIASDR